MSECVPAIINAKLTGAEVGAEKEIGREREREIIIPSMCSNKMRSF